MKKALVTGAGSGIGKAIALRLADMGYDLVLCGRRKERLIEIKDKLCGVSVKIQCGDLSDKNFVLKLFEENKDVTVLVNNAGKGVFGKLDETDLEKELEMINVNIVAMHILTKKYLKLFKEQNSGYILNIASSASFFPGPLFSSYYASKAYTARLSSAVFEELRRDRSNVKICYVCPGPVDTEFSDVAGVHFSVRPVTADFVAKQSLNALFKGKRCVTPSFIIKCTKLLSKIIPERISQKIVYTIQKKKTH